MYIIYDAVSPYRTYELHSYICIYLIDLADEAGPDAGDGSKCA